MNLIFQRILMPLNSLNSCEHTSIVLPFRFCGYVTHGIYKHHSNIHYPTLSLHFAMSMYPPFAMSVYLPFAMSVNLPFAVSMYPPFAMSVNLPFAMSVYLFVVSVHVYFAMSVYRYLVEATNKYKLIHVVGLKYSVECNY